MDEIIIVILEIIGVISFSISGAMVAIRSRFDVFGVIVIGCITSTGGGVLRDVIIGNIPPLIFSRPYIFGISALVSIIVFIILYKNRKIFTTISEKTERINNLFDAIGLATFTVLGTAIAFQSHLSENLLLIVIVGLLTGVGGGILRDVLTATPPFIFRKHIYALAAIAGSGLYYLLRFINVNELISSVVSMSLIIIIRLLATKYRWDLPRIDISNDIKDNT